MCEIARVMVVGETAGEAGSTATMRLGSNRDTAKKTHRLDHLPARHDPWRPGAPELPRGREGATEQVPGGQASKGIRWMPRHQEAMKDVAKLR